MPRTFPWYSATAAVYHNNSNCYSGRTIGPDERREGTGGKVMCQLCVRLNGAERYASAFRESPDYSTS